MRNFLLSLSSLLQFLFIVLGTILVAFTSALIINYLFGQMELISKAGLITSIYTVLGTIYAVLIAFSVSGVWQNYSASELSVSAEAAAIIDLIHTVRASATAKAEKIEKLAIEYIKTVISIEWPMLAKNHREVNIPSKSQSYLLAVTILHEVQSIEPTNARENVIFSHALDLITKWLDARRARIMISKGNIAKSLWPLLISGAFILFAFHGLFITKNPILWSALLLLFSGIIGLLFYLIFTLDCPFGGTPSINLEPFKWSLDCLTDKTYNHKV